MSFNLSDIKGKERSCSGFLKRFSELGGGGGGRSDSTQSLYAIVSA